MVGMTGRPDPMIGGGARRRGRLILIASLALNLLLIGVVGVWAVRPFFRGPPRPPQFGRMVERMAHRLSDADAAALRHAYDSRHAQMDKLNVDVRDARRNVRRALQADPFDPDALKSALDSVRSARSAVEEEIQDVMRDGATNMSPEGRRRLARGPHAGPR
jgi:uncharacterized membrane protein